MPDALSGFTTRRTPQSEQARPEQVQNAAGGYVFRTGDDIRLHRFLTIGTEGGTYYTTEKALTRETGQFIAGLAEAGNTVLTDTALTISEAGRAPRDNPALFSVAAAAGLGPEHARAHALDVMPRVARTGSHLVTWAAYAEQFRGWGPQLVKAIGGWYNAKSPAEMAYQVLKYKSRDGWAQRDLMRLAKYGRVPVTGDRRAIYDYVMKGTMPGADVGVPLLHDVAELHRTTSVVQWENIILSNRSISWEMLPSEALAQAEVWRALIDGGNLPVGALLRNLSRLTRLGVLAPMDTFTGVALAPLRSPEILRKARVHPMSILVALRTYAQGHGARGRETWTPVPSVTDTLDAAFYQAFHAVEPSGKRTLVAVDISGSMDHPAGGLPLTCREAAAAVAMTTMATEPLAMSVAFSDGKWPSRFTWSHNIGSGITPLDLSHRRRLDDVMQSMKAIPMGGTNCAVPMLWAAENGVQADVFEIITDNETWYGDVHPFQALRAYREKTGINARLSVVAMTATGTTIADPADPGMLDVSGFDAAVPKLLADFARGDL